MVTSSPLVSAQPTEVRTEPVEPVVKGSIAIAIYVHYIVMGGMDFVLLRLADYFARQGCKVWLVMLNQKGTPLDIIPPSIEVVNPEQSSTLRALMPLRRFLIDHRPDVLLTSMPLNNLSPIIAGRLDGGRTRVIASEHIELDPKFLGHNRVQQIVLPYLMPFLYARTDALVVVSAAIKKQLVDFGVPERVVRVMPNPALDTDSETAMHLPVDDSWFGDRSVPIVIGVGRLHIRKYWANLIRAFARLRKTTPVRFVLVGDGEEEARLHALVAELGPEQDVWLTGHRRDPLALLT